MQGDTAYSKLTI